MDLLRRYRSAPAADSREFGRRLEEAERVLAAALIEESSTAGASKRAAEIRAGGPLPFAWNLHFAEVFDGQNGGFDIVIANPPYVRARELAKDESGTVEDYKTRFRSLGHGDKDLYLAFVEQALALAGRAGRVAFIMPNFARTQAAGPLREILAARGAVDLWVDFGDQQIFDTAINYVALLFLNAQKRGRKQFDVRRPELGANYDRLRQDWLERAPKGTCPYREIDDVAEGSHGRNKQSIWRPLSSPERKFVAQLEAGGHSVGEACSNIGVGVQTSADDVYLLDAIGEGCTGCLRLWSDWAKAEVELELGALRPCAKGSAHLKPNHFEKGCWLLWPYDEQGDLSTESAFKASFPKAWRYLSKARGRLERRSMDRRTESPGTWMRFGRDQGVRLASMPKILMPSLMKPATAWYDADGRVAFTASGKGGGGAYALIPKDGDKAAKRLTAWLNSEEAWGWLKLEGDPRLDGWRGIDATVLGRMPFPHN
jgi:hypothetical protein